MHFPLDNGRGVWCTVFMQLKAVEQALGGGSRPPQTSRYSVPSARNVCTQMVRVPGPLALDRTMFARQQRDCTCASLVALTTTATGADITPYHVHRAVDPSSAVRHGYQPVRTGTHSVSCQTAAPTRLVLTTRLALPPSKKSNRVRHRMAALLHHQKAAHTSTPPLKTAGSLASEDDVALSPEPLAQATEFTDSILKSDCCNVTISAASPAAT